MELFLYGLVGALAGVAYVAGYFYGMRRTEREMHNEAYVTRLTEREKGFSEGYRMGMGEGGRVMCMSIVQNPDMEHDYRHTAARLAKLCGHCGRTCIHCAKQGH